jgi:tripartite-type tricarboxylate transporter receptor subunit TctC
MNIRSYVAGLALALIATVATAQDYPTKPIRLIIPYAAGSVAEVLFRTLTPVLEPKLGQRFVVDARPGADGNIGMTEAARAAPDGYTLVLAPTANFAVLGHLMKDLPFDALNSFEHISMIAETWPLCTVGPGVPAKNLKELADYVRNNPGKLNYGSQGTGSPTHLIGAAFSQLNGNSMVHIPYKGTPPMITAMLAGDVQVTFASMTAVMGQLKGGKLRAIAVMGRERQPELPDLPTAVEAGFPQLVMSNWWVVAAPKGTPARAVDRLATELRASLTDPDVRKRYAEVGHIPVGMSPVETAAFLKSESVRYKGIVEAGNIKLGQ